MIKYKVVKTTILVFETVFAFVNVSFHTLKLLQLYSHKVRIMCLATVHTLILLLPTLSVRKPFNKVTQA